MRQVLLKPLWETGNKNGLWDIVYPWTFNKWREAAAEIGIALNSWDEVPLDRADCVWLLDLPDTKKRLLEARKQVRPGIPFVLHVMETPVGRAHNFQNKNRRLCDYVVTYEHHLPEQNNYFKYRLPHSLGGFHGISPPFHERRCSLMVNTNRVEGWMAVRQPGIIGLPGIGRNLSGWNMPLWSWLQPAKGELYSWRRSLARTAEAMDPEILDIIGPGWHNERISWCPWYSKRAYKCRIASGTNEKLNVAANYKFCISVENFYGSHDYISEKIIDPMLTGTVPVYLGDQRISEVIPAAAFVDVRNFKNQKTLLSYLRSCSRAEWENMQHAGRAFLNSKVAQEFSTETFIKQMNAILIEILDSHGNSKPKLG